jgi:nitrogen regulatory protein PII
MKAILITYNQAYYDEIAKVLNDNGTKGYTEWNEIKGHGSNTGEPHYGTHAWPTLNNAIISIVDDDKVDGILNQLHEKDLKTPDLGLRAFCWNVEKMI